VTAAERQVQLAHSSVLTRAHEPPSKPAKRWSAGREKNLVVNFARFARPIVMNDVLQSQPAIPRIAHAGLEFHVYLVIVKIEPHFATQVGAGANSPPPHHVVDIEPQCAFDCRPPAISSAAVPAHDLRCSDFPKSIV
jgi:hypothetical protein